MRRRRIPKAAPATKIVAVDLEPKKRRFVQHFAKPPAKTALTPVLPIHAERAEIPPSFLVDRRSIPRRHTLPMEPIPEQDKIAGCSHITQPIAVNKPRRLSTHPNESIILEEHSQPEEPIVQRSEDLPSRQPTQAIPEPTPVLSRRPSSEPGPHPRRHSLGSSEAAPTVIKELKDQQQVPSPPPPPPRAATTLTLPAKASTVVRT
jgi:hypothetical protein